MQEIYNNTNEDTTCEDLFNFGFNSHPACFVSYGFCVDILQQFENLDCYAKQFCNDIKESQRARLAFQQVCVSELHHCIIMFIIIIHL